MALFLQHFQRLANFKDLKWIKRRRFTRGTETEGHHRAFVDLNALSQIET
jgi:hypothetical protein